MRPNRKNAKTSRIEVDKKEKAVRAFGNDGKLVAFYPATIGSTEKPAPDGAYKVRAMAENPTYYYDPGDLSFKRNSRSRRVPTIQSARSGSTSPRRLTASTVRRTRRAGKA